MNKIQFSQKFKNFCSKNNLDINMVYLCQCSLMAENPQECLSVLLESLRSDDFDQLLRLVLCNWEDEFVIRSEVPLFFMIPDEVVEKKEKGKDKFNEYIQLLLDKGLNSKGSANNQCEYIVIKKDKVTREAFDYFMKQRSDLDLNKLATVTVRYYEEGGYKTVLSKYIESGALGIDYDSIKEEAIKPKYKGLR